MKISDLNRKVTLQRPVRADNQHGGATKGWTDAGPVWAQMIPLRGGEALQELVAREVQLWKVTIRFRGDVTPDWRIMFEGAPLNIQSAADPDGRRTWLVMTCESGVRT